MTYYFHVRGATLAAALAAVSAELDRVAVQQPAHAIDREQIGKVVESHTALLTPQAGKDVAIYVSGSIGVAQNQRQDAVAVTRVNINVSAHFVPREGA